MLLKLIIKYFFHNRKRTYRAVGILSVGLSLIIITNMLILGYIREIEVFASIVEDENQVIQIISSKNNNNGDHIELFPIDTYNQIISVLNNQTAEIKYSSSLHFVSELTFGSTTFGAVEIEITNITRLNSINVINNDTEIDLNGTLISREANSYINAIGHQFNILYENYNFTISNFQEFYHLIPKSTDILIEMNSSNIPTSLKNRYNKIEIYAKEETKERVIRELKAINGIQILAEHPQEVFLVNSANQIARILLIMQLLMSTLLILSITYVMVSLVQDSEKDINLFNLIGLQKRDIWLLFQGQALLSSIFSCLVSGVFSLIFLNIVYPMLTVFMDLPYTTVVLDNFFILQASILTIIVGIIAGIYPAYLGVKR